MVLHANYHGFPAKYGGGEGYLVWGWLTSSAGNVDVMLVAVLVEEA
jgi:hypothetical protein